jgi:hypothetical protein
MDSIQLPLQYDYATTKVLMTSVDPVLDEACCESAVVVRLLSMTSIELAYNLEMNIIIAVEMNAGIKDNVAKRAKAMRLAATGSAA